VENAKYQEFFKKSNSRCDMRRNNWGIIASIRYELDTFNDVLKIFYAACITFDPELL
jgi:hypothetical protein